MSVLEKVSVASGRSSSRVPFGWAGIIELTPQPTGLRIEHLSSYFQPVSGTATAVTWHGEGMAAFSLQHQADSLLAPGSSSLRIPSVGPCQGMVHGWFFSPSAATPPVPPSESLPEAISHKITFDYVEHGLAAFTRLNGTWAGVIWDKAKQRAVFARDGAGFETLYVVRREPQIIFASDLRILRLAGWAGEYDEQAIAEFLYFLHVPSPRSVYKDVRCVLPGHALIVEPQGIRQERFAPRRFVQGVKLGDDEKVQSAIQESLPPFEERLLTAVASCIPQRGRIGLLMSAGKDSPALAIALRDAAPDRVVALTVASPDPHNDEAGYAARICRFLGIPHRVYTPQADELIPSFLRMVACQEQPMGDPAALPLFLAAFGFPEDVSVLWDGSGNDDYFGFVREADSWSHGQRLQFQRVVPGFAWPLFLWAMQRGPERFASTAREWRKPLEERVLIYSGWTQEEQERLWQQDIGWSDTYLYEMARTLSDEDWVTQQTEAGSVPDPDSIIRKTVHAGRAAGLAVRMPYIDNRLAEFVNGLPQELQYQGYTNKILLRAYLAKHLPNDLIDKPRRGFVALHQLLLQSKQGLLLSWLREAGLLQVFPSWSEAYIARMLSAYRKRPDGYVHRMYALSLLSVWMAMSRGRTDWEDLCATEN